MNATGARADAYLSSIASHDAILIFGESAVKAVTGIEYTVPVIIINATGALSAKGPVFRVFDADFGSAPADAASVSDAGSISLSAGDVAAGKQKAFKCDGKQSSNNYTVNGAVRIAPAGSGYDLASFPVFIHC